ncbi:prestalk protein-like isoform X2 [Contarinia nasturtii]|uniref:prestalk protein-like isoform X2 n=1 Tax=Contarinia nasturtii TaxID=265458 RepID=UPI0012D39C22|nr:prestalk protein-like isoform X2 [Contarinia nasturtii]
MISLLWLLVVRYYFCAAHELQCYTCSSDILTACSVDYILNQEELPYNTCPLNTTSCFTKVENGITYRGCLTPKKVGSKAVTCNDVNECDQICHTSKCNRNTSGTGSNSFQTKVDDNVENKPLRCIECDSRKAGEECVDTSFANRVECPSNMGCYHHFDGKSVRRGCLVNLDEKARKKCELDSDECKKCAENECNWRPSFQSCIKTDLTESKSKICKRYTDQCFTHVSSDIVRRGCVSDITESPNEDGINITDCELCIGWNCNSRTTVKRCLICDTGTDNNQCAINAVSNYSQICTNPNDHCYIYIGEHQISRGCVSESDELFKECQQNPKKCSICTTDNCNNKNIMVETCASCDSRNNEQCHLEPTRYANKICSEIQTTDRLGCYLRVNDEHYERGCVRDLDRNSVSECEKQTENCKTCKAKDCNIKMEFQRCIHCNSINNPECNIGVTSKEWQICEGYLSTCVTGIDAHGYTHRRCSREYHDQDIEFPNRQYMVCTQNMCNTGIFPRNRIQCYRCNGDKENCDFMPSNLMENKLKLVPCDMFSTLDQCYTYLEDNKMYRGCLTDQSDHRLLCEDDSNKKGACVKCTETGCNNVPKTRPPSLSCVRCGKSEECAFGQDKKNAVPCSNIVPFGVDESCFIRYNLVDGWAVRGCTNDDDDKTPTFPNNNTLLCRTSTCNYDNVIRSSCVSCESGLKGKCAEISDEKSLVKQCEGTYPYEYRGCFTIMKNKTVHRGCIKDLSEEEYEICKSDGNCDLCLESNCNRNSVSSSTKIAINRFMIAANTLIIFHFNRFLSNHNIQEASSI